MKLLNEQLEDIVNSTPGLPGNFKNRYRTALDNLPITWSDGELIINEANYAFKLNMDVFDEIGSTKLRSMNREFDFHRILQNAGSVKQSSKM